MSNTSRFNRRVQALQASKRSSVSSSRRQRGPAHGLQGDANSQQKSGSQGTSSFCHSQVQKMREKAVAQEYPPARTDEPMPYAAPYGEFGSSYDWLNQASDGDDEEVEEEDTEVEKTAQKVRVEYCDFRTKRQRMDASNKSWEEQREGMVDAYMDWCIKKTTGEVLPPCNKPLLWVDVVDVFGTEYREIPRTNDKFDSASLIHSGILPTSPLKHSVGFTICTISLYHNLFVRCPRLGVQPFARTLCNLEGVAFRPYLSSQIYTALDVYVSLLNGVRKRVRAALGRQGRNWRMLNTCPALQMDGNDSLMRVERKEDQLADKEEAGIELPPASRERIDRRVAGEDYFASLEETKVWDKSNWATIEETSSGADAALLQHVWAEGHCEERWHNMKEGNTVKSAAKFRENGWFVLLCRHMMVLAVCDMVQSGKLARYPLALLHLFMAAEKEDRDRNNEGRPKGSLAVAYDIACKFSKTISQSLLKGLAQWSNYLPVVGTMHGYAHECLCQLLFLMLYVVGCGLENGEGDERFFNVSNSLAPITRHQSTFHCRQAISEFLYYKDIETYANMSRFLYRNYKQALGITSTRDALSTSMKTAGITSAQVFYDWLVEEGEYLRNLCSTPPQETVQMEYYLKLEALRSCQSHLLKLRQSYIAYVAEGRNSGSIYKRKHRNEEENERKLISDVQALEACLSVEVRWVEGCDEWIQAKKMVKEAAYRKALDKLERLLVAWMFEMARLNVSSTGYKMRKHIGQSLKNRSKSIQSAIVSYNEAAAALNPPRQKITWDQIVDFSYLSEFDILRDTPEEELSRVHVEVKRLLTYIVDEEKEVCDKAREVEADDPALALQLRLYWREQSRFNALHRSCLFAITKLKGFNHANHHYWVIGSHVTHQRGDIKCMEDGAEGTGGWEEEEEEEEVHDFESRVTAVLDMTFDKN
ncbi:hypothetical protein BT96DRAFT_995208 [Gymnopus androsaceus JB14]|uniref:Uncharacterized protein n=1 Tax=Gymnopus androsaceus JB14 TaxID=1447944 RepID=A0A6A4HH63_9AGAR|nr:hypothetical protein BT96DRAFT_995208 [Gymnopus androsaceus JB14]